MTWLEALQHLAPVRDHVGPMSEPFQGSHGHSLVDDVVLGEQDPQRLGDRRSGLGGTYHRARGGRALGEDRPECVAELGELQGLEEHRRNVVALAQVGGELPGGREQNDRQRPGFWQLPQLARQRETVHARHLVVEQGHVVGIALSDPRERFRGRLGVAAEHAPLRGLQLQQTTIGGVVVDDEHSLADEFGRAACERPVAELA